VNTKTKSLRDLHVVDPAAGAVRGFLDQWWTDISRRSVTPGNIQRSRLQLLQILGQPRLTRDQLARITKAARLLKDMENGLAVKQRLKDCDSVKLERLLGRLRREVKRLEELKKAQRGSAGKDA